MTYCVSLQNTYTDDTVVFIFIKNIGYESGIRGVNYYIVFIFIHKRAFFVSPSFRLRRDSRWKAKLGEVQRGKEPKSTLEL